MRGAVSLDASEMCLHAQRCILDLGRAKCHRFERFGYRVRAIYAPETQSFLLSFDGTGRGIGRAGGTSSGGR
ncbi:MAG TPA: hypothetical protein ENI48_12775 [Thioploca sp.]|nr:hypothetical protein [Thioploca sp.]